MPTLAEIADSAYVGYPQLQRQVNRMRLAQMGRIPENLADPRTYGFVKGLLGTTPDELGMSVLSPNTALAKEGAYTGYQLANLGQIAPVMMPATKAALRGVGGAINDAMVYGEGPLARITPQPMRLDVYHGSPYKFEKFDASKIGTGEGAQSYGHGIYVAENPEVAKTYAKEYTDTSGKRTFAPVSKANQNTINYFEAMLRGEVPRDMRNNAPVSDEYIKNQILQLKQQLPSFYKVHLPDEHIEKMLDWDIKLKEQPKSVQDSIKKYWKDNPSLKYYGDPMEMTGEGIHGSVMAASLPNSGSSKLNMKAAQEAAAMDMKYYGIPGIKYDDQFTRGSTKSGTRNFVIFPGNEHLLDIKTINDQPLK